MTGGDCAYPGKVETRHRLRRTNQLRGAGLVFLVGRPVITALVYPEVPKRQHASFRSSRMYTCVVGALFTAI